jgi:hypothetical protein
VQVFVSHSDLSTGNEEYFVVEALQIAGTKSRTNRSKMSALKMTPLLRERRG